MNQNQPTIDAIAEHACNNPFHQRAYATSSDIEKLAQEVRKNSIDINQHLAIIRELFSRVRNLEEQLNHRNQ